MAHTNKAAMFAGIEKTEVENDALKYAHIKIDAMTIFELLFRFTRKVVNRISASYDKIATNIIFIRYRFSLS